MNIKEVWYEIFTSWQKLVSVTIRYNLNNANQQPVSSKARTHKLKNPLQVVFRSASYHRQKEIALQHMDDKYDVVMGIAKKFYNETKKKKIVENIASVYETDIIKGMTWHLESFVVEYVDYKDYLDLKSKGKLERDDSNGKKRIS